MFMFCLYVNMVGVVWVWTTVTLWRGVCSLLSCCVYLILLLCEGLVAILWFVYFEFAIVYYCVYVLRLFVGVRCLISFRLCFADLL